MRALADLVGGNGIHFVSFNVLQNNPFRFEVNWQNCSLPKTCGSTDTDTVNDILFNTASLESLSIRKYFPANITIFNLDSTCKNTPPSIKSFPLNLTIPVCGKYTYKLPNNLAEDKEDRDPLTIALALSTGGPLQRDSWIRYLYKVYTQ